MKQKEVRVKDNIKNKGTKRERERERERKP